MHVHPAALALEGGKFVNQRARQLGHALLVQPGGVLLLRLQQRQQQRLRLAHIVDARQLVAKLALLAFLVEQRSRHAFGLAAGDGLFQLHALGRKRFGRGLAQRLGGFQKQRLAGLVKQRLHRLVKGGQVREHVMEMRHAGLHHALRIGQQKFGALVQRGLQSLVRLVAAMLAHQRLVAGALRRLGCHAPQPAPPHLGARGRIVFQQLIGRGQAQLLQQFQRRGLQQRGKPAVKRAHLHGPGAHQQAGMRTFERGGQPCGLRPGHAAQRQLARQIGLWHAGKSRQPFIEALAHFARRLAREGDGQNFMRRQRRAVRAAGRRLNQRPQDAADQHPRLARARARLDRHAAARIAGNGIKRIARDGLVVVKVGGSAHRGQTTKKGAITPLSGNARSGEKQNGVFSRPFQAKRRICAASAANSTSLARSQSCDEI